MNKKNELKKKSSMQKRLIQHHLPLAVIAMISVGMTYQTVDSKDVIFRISMATAYPALAFLSATLMVSPVHTLLNRTNPVSTDFRRDLGFWAAMVSLVHVVFGLNVHMRGKMWLLFLNNNMDFPFIRIDLFGAANFSGLIATLVLAMLLATSNDWAINKFGWKKWKRLQRWNYGLFILVVLHGVLYVIIEKRLSTYIYIFSTLVAMVVITRLAGFFHGKRNRV